MQTVLELSDPQLQLVSFLASQQPELARQRARSRGRLAAHPRRVFSPVLDLVTQQLTRLVDAGDVASSGDRLGEGIDSLCAQDDYADSRQCQLTQKSTRAVSGVVHAASNVAVAGVALSWLRHLWSRWRS